MDSLEALRRFKRIAGRLGFPRVRRRFIRQHYEHLDQDRAELEEYEQCSSARHKTLTYTIIALMLVHVLKSLAISGFSLYLIDFREPERSVQQHANGSIKFMCVSTNCSRLSRDSPIHVDLSRMPLLEMCYPRAMPLFPHVFSLSAKGPFQLVVLSLSLLLICVGWPLSFVLLNISCSSLMFLVAPSAGVRLARLRVRELFAQLPFYADQLELSADTAEDQAPQPPGPSSPLSHGAVKPDLAGLRRLGSAGSSPASAGQDASLLRIAGGFGERSLVSANKRHELEDLIVDTVPIIRTNWWRLRTARLTVYGMIVFGMGTLTILIGDMVFLYQVMADKARHLAEMAGYAQRAKCAIWHSHDRSARPIDLARVDIQQDWVALTELAFVYSTFYIHATSAFVLFYMTNIEASVWLGEIKHKMIYMTEFARLRGIARSSILSVQRLRRLTRAVEAPPEWRRRGVSLVWDAALVEESEKVGERISMVDLNDEIVKSVRSALMFFHIQEPQMTSENSSALKAKVATQQFIMKLMIRDCSDESFIVMMEKFYVSACFFIQSIPKYSRAAEPIFFGMNMLNYAVTICCIYITRKTHSSSHEALMFTTIVVVMAALTVAMGANFHASTKKLSHYLWTIIALTSGCTDPRLIHIRGRLLNHAKTISTQGGLAMSAFGSRITYVNFIQFLARVATIYVLTVER